MVKPGSIFISYRRSDSIAEAGRVYDKLVEAFGSERIFKDVDNIPYGANFVEYLDQAVAQCDVFIPLIGRSWLTVSDAHGNRRLDDPNDFVRIEIASALKRDILVLPILIGGAIMPSQNDLPDDLKPLALRNAAQARYDPDFHSDMRRIIAKLKDLFKNRGIADTAPKRNDNKKNEGKFWTTLPGILTGIVGTVTAIGVLVAAFDQTNASPDKLFRIASTQWDTIASDNFSSNVSNWSDDEIKTADGDTADININGGKYYFDALTTDGAIFPIQGSNIEVPQSPFYIKADMKRTSDAEGCFYALTWGTAPDGQYSYRVNDAKKDYALTHYNSYSKNRNEKENVIESAPASLIQSGELNRLSVLVNDKIIYLFINEELVEQVSQEYSGEGKIGLQFSVCNDNSQVSFEVDNLEVRVPN